MSFKNALQHGWQHFLEVLLPEERNMLLDILREEYIEEAQDVEQFSQHAERMRYPQFRERLLRIAEEEQAHVEWLRQKIVEQGGEVPQITFTPKTAWNSWACLLMDMEEEKRCCGELLERLYVAEQVDSDIADGLRNMRAEEQRHREEIQDMLMRSDSHAWPADQR